MEQIHTYVIAGGLPVPSATYRSPQTGLILYEVLRVVNGKGVFWDDHMDRFVHSAQIAAVQMPLTRQELRNRLDLLVQSNRVQSGNIKIIVQYDRGTVRHEAMYFIQHRYPAELDYQNGVHAVLFRAERENPNAKIIQDTLRQRINMAIAEEKAYEAILVHPEGYMTEGSRSNFFLIRDKTVYTAPETDVLPGITRKHVVQICRNLSIQLVEKRIDVKLLANMDAAFISGTSPKVLPVSSIDEIKFNPIHPTLATIMHAYDHLLENVTDKAIKHV